MARLSGGGNCSASNVDFDNTGTSLSSTNVQDAIEELSTNIKILNLGIQTIPAGGSQIAIPATDIPLTDYVLSVFTNYSVSGVMRLVWAIYQSSSQWIIGANNLNNSEISTSVYIVYLKRGN